MFRRRSSWRSEKGGTVTTTRAGSGIGIERRYRGSEEYDAASYGGFSDEPGVAGETDPMLTEPIDFDAEREERERTREPLPPVDTDLTNSDFGI
jgi:hypothetical protein